MVRRESETMNIVIGYESYHGNTRTMAYAIERGAREAGAETVIGISDKSSHLRSKKRTSLSSPLLLIMKNRRLACAIL
jgi:flavorubredoxin